LLFGHHHTPVPSRCRSTCHHPSGDIY
jgi:hypothetical protein